MRLTKEEWIAYFAVAAAIIVIGLLERIPA